MARQLLALSPPHTAAVDTADALLLISPPRGGLTEVFLVFLYSHR